MKFKDTSPDKTYTPKKQCHCAELLEALELAYDLLNTMTTNEYSRGGDANVRHVLRTAIAKAKEE